MLDGFLRRSEHERRQALLRATEQTGLSETAIEKDLWVCWALDALFRSGPGAHLTLKGGTSLSKGWNLIERFSEDLDIVVDREQLGFAGDTAPEAAASRREQERRADAVQKACATHVEHVIMPVLRQAAARVGLDPASAVQLDHDASDRQTILVHYPSVLEASSYLASTVRVELGARSDPEPREQRPIQTYLSLASSHQGFQAVEMRVVAPERTFLEKVCLLHEQVVRGGEPATRQARHFYDLHCLHKKGVSERAIHTAGLMRRVVDHRKLFFRGYAQAQQALEPGRIRLIPGAEQMKSWRQDYSRMSAMLSGVAPDFPRLMDSASEIEGLVNKCQW